MPESFFFFFETKVKKKVTSQCNKFNIGKSLHFFMCKFDFKPPKVYYIFTSPFFLLFIKDKNQDISNLISSGQIS